MKIALAQMRVIPNRQDKNLETILRLIGEAKRQSVDLIAFPEMCVGGYLLSDRWLNDDFCRDLMEYNEEIRKASQGIAVAFGNVYLDENPSKVGRGKEWHPNKDGRLRKFNATYIVQNGEYAKRAVETDILPKGVQPKTLLPNYRIFDDERYFLSLRDVADDYGAGLEDLLQPFVITVGGKEVKVGLELCEDLWCTDYRKDGEALNPSKYLIDNGAELLINMSASPWTYGKNGARDRRVGFLKEDCGDFVPFYYVNCTGPQNNGKNIITFDGGSTVYNSDGEPVLFGNSEHQEELMIVDTDAAEGLEMKLRKEKPKIAQKYEAIIEGIRYIKEMNGLKNQPKYVIGLSGGIDSGVVAALLSIAVGKDNVLAVNMPTIYNSEKTKRAAEEIADNLSIAYVQMPIGELVDKNEEMLESLEIDDYAKLSSLNKENIQAKIRATNILSNLASKYGALFTSNGNKLEIALGYATLYGDVGGAYAPIGDLTKTEVVELAKYLNSEVFKREVIPATLIPDNLFRFGKDQIIPTAELKDNQIDPMKFGYHCALLEAFTDYKKKTPEDVMRWYLAGSLESNLGISTDMIRRWGIEDPKSFVEDLEWFDGLIQRNVFKRIQAPPIIMTSKSAYGFDIRESILPYRPTNEYTRLKEGVLAMPNYIPKREGGK
jgi:NAD+ synthase (glutamine-hydrolysing)